MTTTTLVLGGTGATGKYLITQLLQKDQNVRAIVRSKDRLLEAISSSASKPLENVDDLSITEASVLQMRDEEIERCVKGCDFIVSCLGHNMSFKGIFGKPYRLVEDALKRVCDAAKKVNPTKVTKVILMGSNGVANPDKSEDLRPRNERIIIGIIRALVPPHSDNEAAADYLSSTIGKEDENIKWVVVRPDDLIDGDVSEYFLTKKYDGLPLFGGGETTRSNVAAFMSELILNDNVWNEWVYQMPIIRNVKEMEKAP